MLFGISFSSFHKTNFSIEELSEQNWLDTAEDAWYMTDREKAMVRELNLVRFYPQKYLELIRSERSKIVADKALLSRLISETTRIRVTIDPVTKEESRDTFVSTKSLYENKLTAVDDLIKDLEKQKPLLPLEPHYQIYKVAEDHGAEQMPTGDIAHQGFDGSWPMDRIKKIPSISNGNENIAAGGCTPREIVIQLLIDSGVPGYGHRYNILNGDWEFVGCHEVLVEDKTCGNYWIQDFGTR